MGKLCIYLPPFASDYTGVSSALFDLDCLTVIADAKCCTSHVVYWDEPRWGERSHPTVSAQLQSMDVILGNDQRMMNNILSMEQHIDTQLLALIGTPVPAITGMDLDGMAHELETHCKKPVLSFSTSGFSSYDHGIYLAGKTLLERFALNGQSVHQGNLNLLGLTPLDHGNVGNDLDLTTALKREGWQISASLFMGLSLSDLSTVGTAEYNLALSASGLRLAQMLQARFGTPYRAAVPMGSTHLHCLLQQLNGTPPPACPAPDTNVRTLIVMDQVMGHSLRQALRLAGCMEEICVGTFFHFSPELAEEGDLFFPSEAHFLRHLRDRSYQHLIGDPMLSAIPHTKSLTIHPFAHPAVSGKLHWNDVPRFLSPEFDTWLTETAQQLNFP